MNPFQFQFIRRLHLIAGLVLLIWVVMYFVTGWVLIHEPWFPRGPRKETTKHALTLAEPVATAEFVRQLEAAHGIGGQRRAPKPLAKGGWQFNWVRPGENTEAVVNSAASEVTITRTRFNPAGWAHGLHRLHGYRGGWAYWIWAAFMDLASAAMILFAASGVYLWWKTTRNKLPGVLCLGAGIVFTTVVVTHLL